MNPPPRQTSALAVVSLIMGIVGWTVFPFVGSLVAIVTGHMARGEIRRSSHSLDGDGLAVAGLILGWVAVIGSILVVIGFLLFFGGLALFAASQS